MLIATSRMLYKEKDKNLHVEFFIPVRYLSPRRFGERTREVGASNKSFPHNLRNQPMFGSLGLKLRLLGSQRSIGCSFAHRILVTNLVLDSPMTRLFLRRFTQLSCRYTLKRANGGSELRQHRLPSCLLLKHLTKQVGINFRKPPVISSLSRGVRSIV